MSGERSNKFNGNQTVVIFRSEGWRDGERENKRDQTVYPELKIDQRFMIPTIWDQSDVNDARVGLRHEEKKEVGERGFS